MFINAAVSQNSIALIALVDNHLSSVPLFTGTVLWQKVGAHANLKQGDSEISVSLRIVSP